MFVVTEHAGCPFEAEKTADCSQRGFWRAHEILVSHLEIFIRRLPPGFLDLVSPPPCRGVRRRRSEPEVPNREKDVPAITDDVDKPCLWQQRLDERQVGRVARRFVAPTRLAVVPSIGAVEDSKHIA